MQRAAFSTGATEAIFADDLNMFKTYAADTSIDEILSDLARCQSAVHSWGHAIQVVFDPCKE